jgi:protoporphyrinogen oxidase
MRRVHHLVIGAGPTGVGAACRLHELGIDYLLVEANDQPGGMARSITDADAFTWDLGGHVLHSHFASFDAAIAKACAEMTYPTRNGWILMDGALMPTPIQHQLTEYPNDLQPDAPADNLGDYYRNHFGNELAEKFFIPFQEKMWATPVNTIAHDWTSLRNGSTERNVPQLTLAGSAAPKNAPRNTSPAKFPYPKGGTGQLWAAICANLDQSRILYGTAVSSIDADARLAILSNGETVRYQHLVSTMALPSLLRMTGSTQFTAASSLRANSVFVVGFGFQGTPPEALADKSWLYCADPNVAWHRATMLSNYDPGLAGDGRWNVLFEIGLSSHRRISAETAIESCLVSVKALGADAGMVCSTFQTSVPMGYPVPTLGRDTILTHADAHLTSKHIRSRGRFGGWRYESCNQDYSFQQGSEAVDAALFDTPETCYWHPETYS